MASLKFDGVNKERKLRADLLRRQVLQRFSEGASTGTIAQELSIHPRTALRHLSKALEAESVFPSDLSPAAINQLRQVQSELLLRVMAKLIRRLDAMDENADIADDRKAQVHSAGLKALSLANARLAEMNALNAPVKIVEQQLSLQVKRTENRYEITFDEEKFFSQSRSPVHGLIRGGALLDRETETPECNGHDSMSDPDAT
jgi:hypothetical protein